MNLRGFSTARGTAVNVRVESIRRAQQMFDEQSQSVTPPRVETLSKLSNRNITPVKILNPYINTWKICGRVTAIEPIRNIASPRREIRILNFELTDEQGGKIRVAAFNEQIDRWSNIIHKDGMYYISNATVKQANKRFNNTNHDYELSLRSDSEITICNDRQFLTPLVLNLTKFDELTNKMGELTDVIGILMKVDEPSKVTSRKKNEELDKRDIHLMDSTGIQVAFTLWNKDAVDFTGDAEFHPVIAITNANIYEYQGISLSSSFTSHIHINPETAESHQLRVWFDEEGLNVQPTVLKATNAIGLRGVRDYRLIDVASLLQLGSAEGEQERGSYFNVIAYVNNIKEENALYKACHERDCKKKVIEIDNQYHCEKCGKYSTDFKYVFILQVELSDLSGFHWVTLFDEQAKKLLNIGSDELGRLNENDPDAYKAVFAVAKFRPFTFRIRAKQENYNDEMRIKWVVFDGEKVDRSQYLSIISTTITALNKNK